MKDSIAKPPSWNQFLFFLIPLVFGNILQVMSATLTNIYVGQTMGVKALAAVYAIFPILFFWISLVMGLGAGASVLVGQAFGARDFVKMKAVAGSTLTLVMLLGIAVAVLGGLSTNALLRILSTPADIIVDATIYARLMLIFIPFLFLFLITTSLTLGVGDTKTPMLALVISTICSLLFTAAFIHGWLGLPQFGVASAAVGSILATLVALAWQFFSMRRKNHPLRPDAELWRHMSIDWNIIPSILHIGLPTGVQMIIISIAEIAVLSFVNHFGSDATAAYGAATQVLNYVQLPAISIAITASILGAQAIGYGNTQRLDAITRTGLLMNLWITGTLVILAYLSSRTIVGWFITSASVIELAQTLLHIVLWSVIIFGMSEVLSGVMRASGTVIEPTIISVFSIIAIEVPVAYTLSQHFGLGGIWFAYPTAFTAMFILQAIFYWYIWRPKTALNLFEELK